jgi:hypothetical protein
MAGRVAAYAISASNCTQRGGVPGVRIVKSWPAGGCGSSVIRVPAIVRSGLRRRTLLRSGACCCARTCFVRALLMCTGAHVHRHVWVWEG